MPSTNKGWIKLWRQLKESSVWDYNDGQFKVFITIILSANHGESEARLGGETRTIRPGQMVTSRKNLADMAGVGTWTAKRTTKKLEEDGILDSETYNDGTLLTVLNWGKYQQTEKTVDSELDSEKKSKNENLDSKHHTQEEVKNEVHSTSTRKIKDFSASQKEIVGTIPDDLIEPNRVYGLAGKWLNTYGIEQTVKTIREMDAKDKWTTIRESGKPAIGFIVECIKNYQESNQNDTDWNEKAKDSEFTAKELELMNQ